MTQDQLTNLLKRYQLGALSKEEHNQLMEQLIKDEHGLEIPEALQSLLEKDDILNSYNSERWEPVLNEVLSIDKGRNNLASDSETDNHAEIRRIHFIRSGWLKYAAAIVILIGAGVLIFTKNNRTMNKIAVNQPVIYKAEEKVILTLSNGKQVVLGDSSTNNIADGDILITENNGVLSYNNKLSSETNTTYNIMNTPKGGQYQLILPDGSKVWLNAASSLKYPVVFAGKKREVELTGEAYFEIKENKEKPFIVNALNTNITVLGTRFNVNAYKNESEASTTLVDGSIKISNKKESMIIKPGQQLSMAYSDNKMKLNKPNMDDVLAWREGMFQFENKTIETIMRQLERWYDITVEYKGALPNTEFSGSLSRTENAVMLLDALSLTKKVHFKIEGKKIIVFAGQASK